MRNVALATAIVLIATAVAEARRHESWDTGSGSSYQYERVQGYQKNDGTYVEPYYRTKANDTLDDNYSTRGNDNPWTGKKGYGDTDYDHQNRNSYDYYNK